MKKIINKIKKYRPPKIVMLILIALPIVFCYIKNYKLDNDTWFLLNHGKFVLENGIPNIEPFSMHEGFSFVMQQWASSVIFWIIYKLFGGIGLRIFVTMVFAMIIFIIYKLCMLLSKNKYYLSNVVTIISSIGLVIFMVSRPQIFTYLILILEIYLLELYINKKQKKYLYILPFLSLLQINLHASMWFMMFLFMLPYLIDSFKINLGFIKCEGYNKKHLFIIVILMFLIGFINPYGIDAITYVFNSYGINEINLVVGEMKSLTLASLIGKIGFIYIFGVLFIYVFYKKGILKLRYFLLYCGTTYLFISHVRNFPLFIIASCIPVSSYLKEKFSEYSEKIWPKKIKVIYNILCITLFFVGILVFLKSSNNKLYSIEKNELSGSINYIINNYDINNIKVYTDYNDGSISEFNGLKCYIDPRAEVFLKANNNKEDIFLEYYELQFGDLDSDEFLNKYKFDILLLNDRDVLNKSVNKLYKKVYKDKYRSVYELIK